MVDIRPFQGYTCNPGKYSPSDFITPPYDKIPAELAEKFYAKDFNNIHLILGKILPTDDDANNRYVRAQKNLESWMKEKRLVQSSKPCFYLYRQDFKYKSFVSSRRGVICLLKLEILGEGAVKPHEHTLAKPKEDRLKLLRATRANLGQIFMLYRDPSDKISSFFDCVEQFPPVIKAQDERGDWHQIWEISDDKDIARIRQAVCNENLVIADGHHRYETSLNYRDEIRKGNISGETPEDFIMVTLVNMCQKGLLILPTHRLVRSSVNWRSLVAGAEKLFSIEKVWELKDPKLTQSAEYFLREHAKETSFVLCVKETQKAMGICLRKNVDPAKVRPRKGSPARQKLDIAILHELILEDILGVSEEMLRQESHVGYAREIDEGLQSLSMNDYQYLFLINPTPVDAVVKVALANDRMPQKSTDFYPKLYSGLVVRKL